MEMELASKEDLAHLQEELHHLKEAAREEKNASVLMELRDAMESIKDRIEEKLEIIHLEMSERIGTFEAVVREDMTGIKEDLHRLSEAEVEEVEEATEEPLEEEEENPDGVIMIESPPVEEELEELEEREPRHNKGFFRL